MTDTRQIILTGQEVECVKHLARMWQVARENATATTDSDKKGVTAKIANITGHLLILSDVVDQISLKIDHCDEGV